MTNLEAAVLISKLYADLVRKDLNALNRYAEAVALAIMALNTEEVDHQNEL